MKEFKMNKMFCINCSLCYELESYKKAKNVCPVDAIEKINNK